MKVIHMRSRLPKRWQILRIFPAMFPKLWCLVDFVQEQKTALDGMAEDIGAISDIGEHNLSASEQAAAASHEMMQQAQALQDIAGRFNLRQTQSAEQMEESIC